MVRILLLTFSYLLISGCALPPRGGRIQINAFEWSKKMTIAGVVAFNSMPCIESPQMKL
jgi:hypothetical protein